MGMSPCLLAIEIGGTKLQLTVGTEAGAITKHCRCAVAPTKGAAGIRAQIEQQVAGLRRDHAFAAVGVGFGGPVSWRTGRVARSHQIEGWSGIELAGWLGELCGAPVAVDNDANVAALGEATRGAGSGSNTVFYVTLGSGVGGGLVQAGRIYHGAEPGEAEIGHLRVDRAGTLLELECSGWAVDKKIRALKGRPDGGLLARVSGEAVGGEARHLASALQANDSVAWGLLRETAGTLAFGLSHVVHLFHPEVIILGGGLSSVGEPLRTEVEQALKGYIMEVFRPGLRVALARLGEDAVPIGALELARRLLVGDSRLH